MMGSERMRKKYIHYGSPKIAGVYYQDNDTYFANLDCKGGKVIIMVSAEQTRKQRAIK